MIKTTVPLVLWLALLASSQLLFGQASGTIEIVATEGDQLTSNLIANVFYRPRLTNSGRLFFSHYYNPSEVYHDFEYQAGSLKLIINDGTPQLPSSHERFEIAGINETNFPVRVRNPSVSVFEQGIYNYSAITGQFTPVLLPGDRAPGGGNGTVGRFRFGVTGEGFSSGNFNADILSNGMWVSNVVYTQTQNGGDDNSAIIAWNGKQLVEVAREGHTMLPGGVVYGGAIGSGFSTGTVEFGFEATMNKTGQVSFVHYESGDVEGQYLWDGKQFQKIVREGDVDPEGNVIENIEANTILSDAGQALVLAGMQGGNFDRLYKWENGSLETLSNLSYNRFVGAYPVLPNVNERGDIVYVDYDAGDAEVLLRKQDDTEIVLLHPGKVLPSGNVVASSGTFVSPLLGHGQMNANSAFASVVYTEDGNDIGTYTLVITDGVEVIEVDHNVSISDTARGISVSRRPFRGEEFFNDLGQVAYVIRKPADDSVRLFTPDLYWRTNNSGDWDDRLNWTVSTPPAFVHKTVIAPTSDVTVTGPTNDVIVRRLQVGDDSGFLANLELQAGVNLTSTEYFEVQDGGQLSGSGKAIGDVTIDGQLSPGNDSSTGIVEVEGTLTFGVTSTSRFQLDGVATDEFDRLIVRGDVILNGELEIEIPDDSILADGVEFVIADLKGSISGQFANVNEGQLIHSIGNLQVSATYSGGDGDDFALLVSTVNEVAAFGVKLLDGSVLGGSLADITSSDDVDFQLDTSATTNPTKQLIDAIFLVESPVSDPDSLAVRLELSMLGGPQGDVIQTVSLKNFNTGFWESIDQRAASISDEVVLLTPTGDSSRFIHPITDEVELNLRLNSPDFSGATFIWSSDVDELQLLIN